MITGKLLRQIAGSRARSSKTTDGIAAAVNKYCVEYGVDTPTRMIDFLAMVCPETSGFKKLTEGMNYSAKRLRQVWPRRFKTDAIAEQYAHQPQKLANFVYGNRCGNKGRKNAGWLFRGGGAMQTTFYDNYLEVENETGIAVTKHPGLLRKPDMGVKAAFIFWRDRDLNALSDSGQFTTLRKRINGGKHGLKVAKEARARGKSLLANWRPRSPIEEAAETLPETREDMPANPPATSITKKDVTQALDELRKSGSRTIKSGDAIDKITGIGAGITVVTGVVEQTTSALSSIPSWVWPVIAVAAFAAVIWSVRKIKHARVDDHLRGRNIGPMLDAQRNEFGAHRDA